MARRGSRGWKSYIPSVQTGVKVFVSLVAIKIGLGIIGSTIGAKIPSSVSKYFPVI